MDTPNTIPATLRGKAAITEVSDLLGNYMIISDQLEAVTNANPKEDHGIQYGETIVTTIRHEEIIDVLQRRLAAVSNLLENKGIRIAPEPTVA
jgi:hypothetical protein